MFDVTPAKSPNGLTVAELFAGGGLMAVGLKQAGFSIIWANDFDKHAVGAYRHNLGNYIVKGDITKIPIKSIPEVDVIAGGPPCQDYSVAGLGAGENGASLLFYQNYPIRWPPILLKRSENTLASDRD
ncbi:DNA (cytosine-5)-methyltransferase 1 [Marininema mesophilum]|uniref:DNA (cytosine-5-)-methyltransferase n=1 Tax=Marininema mesophilum TaxID=1048340 RepID=A0A1H2T3Q9_9BACL|nr:DNA cytosine methyltransferase [Marininema mesophilum]SDW38501.1 DNA (cytosine-5)-methyltransferase 1 [Marininema mesophilum]